MPYDPTDPLDPFGLQSQDDEGGYVEGMSPEVVQALMAMGSVPPDMGAPPGLEALPESPKLTLMDRIAAGLGSMPPIALNPYHRGTFGPALAQGLARGFAGARQADYKTREADYEAKLRAAQIANTARWADLTQQRRARTQGGLAFLRAQAAAAGKKLPEVEKPSLKLPAYTAAKMRAAGMTVPDLVTRDEAKDYEAIYGKEPAPASGDTAESLTPEGLDVAAQLFARTGQMVPMGMRNAGVRIRIINRAAELTPDLNVGANQASFRANQSSLAQLQRMFDNVTAFESTALKNADLMLGVMSKVPTVKSPWLNRALRAGSLGLGNDDVAAFNAARQVVAPEFARILQSPTLAGQLTDEARKELEAIVSGSFNAEQMRRAIGILKQDAANRRKAYSDQINAIKQRLGTPIGGGAAPGTQPRVHVRTSDGRTGWVDANEVPEGWEIIP